MTKINTSYGVIVLGDRGTAQRAEKLSEAAIDQGAVIAETYFFDAGEAGSHDELAQVESVLSALSQAIATRTDIWVPFPHEDLCREQHVRRLSLVLQRHGLNLRIGRRLDPCPVDGGYNEVDFALRKEVQAVDALDHAALATAGLETLNMTIERVLAESAQAEPEKFYSTAEVAEIFGQTDRWVYGGMRKEIFTYPDGSVIEPARVGKRGLRRFTLPVIRDMAWSCYRRGILSDAQLKELLTELRRADR